MADKIEVIDALERCHSYGMCDDEGCPYYPTIGCLELLRKDALELLKEQQETIDGLGVLQKVMETVEPVPDYNVRYWRCPKCNWLLTAMIDDQCSIPSRRDNYCSSCGRPLKWQ